LRGSLTIELSDRGKYMEKYIHQVKYYETDKMGITHHSNYIRWMEEARIDYLEQLGWGYDKLEKMGIVSPVLSVNCNYKQSTTFPDKVEITVAMKEFNGLRFKLAYEMRKLPEQTVVCTAVSEHAFLDEAFKPLRLKKEHPDFYKAMEDAVK